MSNKIVVIDGIDFFNRYLMTKKKFNQDYINAFVNSQSFINISDEIYNALNTLYDEDKGYGYQYLKSTVDKDLNEELIKYFDLKPTNNFDPEILKNSTSLECLYGCLSNYEPLKNALNFFREDLKVINQKKYLNELIELTKPQNLDPNKNPIVALAEKYNYPESLLLVLEGKFDEFKKFSPAEYKGVLSCVNSPYEKRTAEQYASAVVSSWVFEDLLCDLINQGIVSDKLSRSTGWSAKTVKRQLLNPGKYDASADLTLIHRDYPDKPIYFEIKGDYTGMFSKDLSADFRLNQMEKLQSTNSFALAFDFKNKVFVIEDTIDKNLKHEKFSNPKWLGKMADKVHFSEEDLTKSFRNALMVNIIDSANKRLNEYTGERKQLINKLDNSISVIENNSTNYLTNITSEDHYYSFPSEDGKENITIKFSASSSLDKNYIAKSVNKQLEALGYESLDEFDKEDLFNNMIFSIKNNEVIIDNPDIIKNFNPEFAVIESPINPINITEDLAFYTKFRNADNYGITAIHKEMGSSDEYYYNPTDKPHCYAIPDCGIAFSLQPGESIYINDLCDHYKDYLIDKTALNKAMEKYFPGDNSDEVMAPYAIKKCQLSKMIDDNYLSNIKNPTENAYKTFANNLVVDDPEIYELLLGEPLQEQEELERW